jgi:hypothetical protein
VGRVTFHNFPQLGLPFPKVIWSFVFEFSRFSIKGSDFGVGATVVLAHLQRPEPQFPGAYDLDFGTTARSAIAIERTPTACTRGCTCDIWLAVKNHRDAPNKARRPLTHLLGHQSMWVATWSARRPRSPPRVIVCDACSVVTYYRRLLATWRGHGTPLTAPPEEKNLARYSNYYEDTFVKPSRLSKFSGHGKDHDSNAVCPPLAAELNFIWRGTTTGAASLSHRGLLLVMSSCSLFLAPPSSGSCPGALRPRSP